MTIRYTAARRAHRAEFLRQWHPASLLWAVCLDPIQDHVRCLYVRQTLCHEARRLCNQGRAAVVIAGGMPGRDQLAGVAGNALRGNQREKLIVVTVGVRGGRRHQHGGYRQR